MEPFEKFVLLLSSDNIIQSNNQIAPVMLPDTAFLAYVLHAANVDSGEDF